MLTSFIEPAIIIVLALVVGFIVLSVLTPMFTIYNECLFSFCLLYIYLIPKKFRGDTANLNLLGIDKCI